MHSTAKATFVSLTWRKASQGSLHIQEHLVVVLIILSIHFIWREPVFATDQLPMPSIKELQIPLSN